MKKNNAFVKTFPVVWIVTIVASVLIWLLGDVIYAISFALGSVTSLMMMSMLFKSGLKVLQSENRVQAERMAWRNYAFRYFFYILIILIANFHPNLNVFWTAGGLFVFKLCLYIVIYFTEKGENK